MAKPDRRSLTIRIQGLDRKHYQMTDRYARQVKRLYDEAAKDYASLAGTIFEPDPNRPFSFADYPRAQKEAARIAADLTKNVQRVIEAGQRSEWLAATYRADEYLAGILDRSKLTAAELQQYEDRNIEGLAAFQGRKVQGLNLSDRVWKCTDQFTGHMELALDVAIGDGRSAQELSRDVRGLLNEPNRLFRRVRDKYGNLRLSKAAAAYHPGRGVYRSSYQNAMRLARTEINMAYKTADWERWQRLDFVVGIRIGLSNNHTTLNSKGKPVPLNDICDELAGDYPKTFKFVGWHPNCRCVVTPILQSPQEMHQARRERLRAIMNDEAYKAQPSANTVTDVPAGFKAHIEAIAERSKGWKSMPFYIRDNFKGGTIAGGLSPAIPHKAPIGGTPATPNKPPQPCTEFDAYIDDLKQQAFSLGLDISKLDPLRAAGQREPLKAEVDRLRAIADDRGAEWLAAQMELRNFLRTCKDAPDDFKLKYLQIVKANGYSLKSYYETCIETLKKGLADAQADWAKIQKEKEAEAARKKAEADKKAKKADQAVAKMFTDQEDVLRKNKVEFNQVKPHTTAVSDDDIIARVGGGDLTAGSCASVGLAFAANKAGYDVRDFRGGDSRKHFCSYNNLAAMGRALGADTSALVSGMDLMKTTQVGKLYYCVSGCHAAIVRKIANGKYEYLELQSATSNGWKPLNAKVFSTRFASRGRNRGFILDIDSFKDLQEFHQIMGYINTNKTDQQKGTKGTIK